MNTTNIFILILILVSIIIINSILLKKKIDNFISLSDYEKTKNVRINKAVNKIGDINSNIQGALEVASKAASKTATTSSETTNLQIKFNQLNEQVQAIEEDKRREEEEKRIRWENGSKFIVFYRNENVKKRDKKKYYNLKNKVGSTQESSNLGWWNNRISSIKIPPMTKLIICNKTNGPWTWAKRECINEFVNHSTDYMKINQLKKYDYDNKISSFKAESIPYNPSEISRWTSEVKRSPINQNSNYYKYSK